MKKIIDIAKKIGVRSSSLQLYGEYKAKIDFKKYLNKKRKGHLILVTAMTPTKVGEGKTTTAIGLADGLNKIKKDAIVVLREPSMGPVFGLKGGGTGGGRNTPLPSETSEKGADTGCHHRYTGCYLVYGCKRCKY